ncbi:Rieske 2Fe-2S domain-containing protein, partial [bacterium]
MSVTEVDLAAYDFFEIASVEEIPNGERIFLEIGSQPVVVFNIAGNFFAIGDVCTHDRG